MFLRSNLKFLISLILRTFLNNSFKLSTAFFPLTILALKNSSLFLVITFCLLFIKGVSSGFNSTVLDFLIFLSFVPFIFLTLPFLPTTNPSSILEANICFLSIISPNCLTSITSPSMFCKYLPVARLAPKAPNPAPKTPPAVPPIPAANIVLFQL